MIKLTKYATEQLLYVAAVDVRRLTAAEDGEGTYVKFGDGEQVRVREDVQEVARLVELEVGRGR